MYFLYKKKLYVGLSIGPIKLCLILLIMNCEMGLFNSMCQKFERTFSFLS